METNREQIMKALECCTRGRKSKEDRPCLDCPYNECNIVGGTDERQVTGTCQGWLMKDALALIKELTEEVDKLGKVLETMSADHNRAIRLTEAYTVRKMQEKLKKYYDRNDMYLGYSIAFNVDRVANEMLEDYSNEKG